MNSSGVCDFVVFFKFFVVLYDFVYDLCKVSKIFALAGACRQAPAVAVWDFHFAEFWRTFGAPLADLRTSDAPLAYYRRNQTESG